MKAGLILPFVLALADARVVRREVPQEHSHNAILATVKASLDLNNPNNISDTVFGLLGNAAAQQGQGTISDTDCLQQATADQAFSNAKAANDVAGMTAALLYRGLERNTVKVGLASVNCTAIQAVNPEIAAISQHQDAAAPGAADNNRQVELALAQQIASIGGDPTAALSSGTFAPGNVADATAKGNSCDTEDDQAGCIVSQNLLQPATTVDELKQAAANVAANGAASNSTGGSAASNSTNVARRSLRFDVVRRSRSFGGVKRANGTGAATGNVDLGSCQSAAIQFAAGLDGRKENSFAPVDTTDFNHGSALGIKVITDFICQQLDAKCEASADTVAQCNTAATAAAGQTGQAAADAFNQALGQTA